MSKRSWERERRAAERGFTLVEVLMAALLLSLLLLATAGVLTAARRSASLAARTARGLHLAQMVLEDIRARKYEEIASEPRTEFRAHPRYPDNPGYFYRVTVTPLSSLWSYRSKRVEVEVSWLEGEQRKSIVLTTVVAEAVSR